MNFFKHFGLRVLFALLLCAFLPLTGASAEPYLGSPKQAPHLPGQSAPSTLQHPNGQSRPAAQKNQTPKQGSRKAPAASAAPDKNHPYLGDPSQPPRLPGGYDPSLAGAPFMVPSTLREENLVLTPYMNVFVDATSSMNIDEVSQPENDSKFEKFRPKAFAAGAGACWLRFYLQPVPEGTRTETYLLDMGESLPGEAVLYSPVPGENGKMEWKESRPGQKGVMVLPEAGTAMTPCYIRLDGLPGTWFAPVVRTPHDAATDWGSLYKMAAMVAMAIILAICLLRGLVEQGYWRTFSVLYLICALGEAVLGMPSSTGPLGIKGICAAAAPGVAMFFLPLIGRSLMRTRETAPLLDWQYLFLSLLGLVYAGVSLIPSLRWLSRFTEVWPLAMFVLVPTTLGACLKGLPGSFRFLLGCVIPPAAVIAGILGMKAGYPPHLLASLPLWGIALGALLVTAFSQPGSRQSNRGLVLDAGPAPAAADGMLSADPGTSNLPGGPAAGAGSLDLDMGSAKAPAPEPLKEEEKAPAAKPDVPGVKDLAVSEFNLQEIMQRTNGAVAAAAEKRGISLSWFMAPNLGLCYSGFGEELESVLGCLLEEGLNQLGKGGTLRSSVKKVPGSRKDGELLFSLNMQGLDADALNSFASLSRAARLSALLGGFLSLECRGSETVLNFTLNLKGVSASEEKPAPKAEAEPKAAEAQAKPQYSAILMADNPNVSADILGILREAGCSVKQAADSAELMKLFDDRNPADLLIFQGRSTSAESSLLLAGIREFCRQKGLRLPVILAYTPDQTSWPDMARTGFTHALTLPVDREALLGTLSEITKAKHGSVVDLTPDMQVEDIPDLFGGAPAAHAAPSAGARAGSTLDINMDPEPEEEAPAEKPASSGNGLPIDIAFDNALLKARAGLASGRMADVAAAAGDIARAAGKARMDSLQRIASLVDRAARAGDSQAVHELLPELSGAVERKIKELNIQR